MLETVFHREILSGLSKAQMKARTKTRNKEWSYIGRFMMGFTLVEYQVNQLFEDLMSPHRSLPEGGRLLEFSAAGHWLTYTLDLRKKLKVLELILESQGIDESATFDLMHSLHTVRNVIAHWPFFEDSDGLSCGYTKAEGDPLFRKPKTKHGDTLIKFAEFDSYDVHMSELYDKFEKLSASVTPIADVGEDLQIAIEEAISTSENVIRYPSKPRKDDER